MRPDRIIVGEVRSGEALDLHDSSLTTANANTPRDALSRLETSIRDGSGKITHIREVQGMEGDTIIMQDLF